MTYNYHPAWGRLYLSVLALVKTDGHLKYRLYQAFLGSLVGLTEKDFNTEEAKVRFNEIRAYWLNDDSDKMMKATDDEAKEIAEKIVSLYNFVAEGNDNIYNDEVDEN